MDQEVTCAGNHPPPEQDLDAALELLLNRFGVSLHTHLRLPTKPAKGRWDGQRDTGGGG